MDYSLTETKKLMKLHNSLVKDMYKSESVYAFLRWFEACKNEDEHYIEIPSNQCKSGHAEILDF